MTPLVSASYLKGIDFSAQLVSIIFIYTEIRIATENVR